MKEETTLATRPPVTPAITTAIEKALVMGDLSSMNPEQRVMFYNAVCESVGLNPLTRPLEYIILNGKLTLYARKDCTEQLRRRDNIAIQIINREVVDDCYVVTAQAMTPEGRTDEAIGAVSMTGLKGEARANAIMKAETKAKRRVTLSICGLGILDETEADPKPKRGGAWHFPSAPELPAHIEESSAEDVPASDFLDIDDIRDIETLCADSGVRMAQVIESVNKRGFARLEVVPKDKKSAILEWIAGKKKIA